MNNTKIEWCDDTVNPWIGCAKVSQACTNCYAESLDKRLRFGGQTNWGAGGNRLIRVDKAIAELHRIAKRGDQEGRPRKVFIASMADVFEDRPDLVEPRARLWAALCEINRERTRLVALLLTKRPEVALDFQRAHVPDGFPSWAWIGCTVENQEAAARRIPLLCHIRIQRGGVRFLSCEPLLGAIDLGAPTAEAFEDGGTGDEWLASLWACRECGGSRYIQTQPIAVGCRCDTGSGIRWVIAGGESGPRARPSHPDWFRSLRDQCATVGVPFHFKQTGEWSPFYDQDIDDPDCRRTPREAPNTCRINLAGGQGFHGDRIVYFRRVGKKAAGRLLDGVEHNGVPSVSP